jgi:hypothetical protein
MLFLMKRKSLFLLVVIAALMAPTVPAYAHGGRPQAPGVIYVSSQGLYYDTYTVVQSLPMKGRFQLLQSGITQYGPGQPGYLGGRWWVDVNGDGIQDAGDLFFLCPLLGPGRATP